VGLAENTAEFRGWSRERLSVAFFSKRVKAGTPALTHGAPAGMWGAMAGGAAIK